MTLSAAAPAAKDAYAAALAEYRAAQDAVSQVRDRLRGLADALDEPLRLAPRHPDATERIPLHVLTSPVRREADLQALPTAEAALAALGALHAAHARAHALYSWLLPADRDQVEAP